MATQMTRPHGPAEIPGHETALTVAPVSALPTIAEVRQRMAWMTEFRPVLLEFVQHHMDPARHMYSFENNRYTPLTVPVLLAMMEQGHKPALNQDGIHNLMSLYECYVDEPTIHEAREDGFYTCRATVKLISFRTGSPMGAGTGSCSTRESKYAYRWVGKSRLPKGVDAASLKQQDRQGDRGSYTVYRLDNEDLADVEATVLQMAVKRAKSAAVKALPLVSEMFAGVGDPDEDPVETDTARQELLAPLGTWLKSLKVAVRGKAILAVFGEPMTVDDIQKLDEDRLVVAAQVLEIATRQGVQWDSATLVADLKAALQASAAQAKADLFGETARGSTPPRQPPLDVDPATGEVLPESPESPTPKTVRKASSASQAASEPSRATASTSQGGEKAKQTGLGETDKDGFAWTTLRAHKDDAKLPKALRDAITTALSADEPATDAEADALAGAVLDTLHDIGA